ncbi:substrate-binding protein [Chitinophaga costaii]|uniref:Substrate-binding protein n=1 Tax=Chitinophaga costaii TaxID=1335309 RepID=A0A1C4G391_9BACT|nr:helical backbone metal receptor [Chitinophaga costaii]PUZ20969.1 cobalamin-binding protein [Chitinophaga costaii]SCC62616.1 substrate-binding protein [Chitinophaga costaii]
MPLFTDQLQRTVNLNDPVRRIVSVVPSQTELLHYLGLEAEVVGITKFCIHPPEWFGTKPRVGGTKQLNISAIRALQPDLVIANKEENDQEQIAVLAKEFPVWISDITTLPDAYDMILRVGIITGRASVAVTLVQAIQQQFATLHPPRIRKTAYFIWRKPWMVAASHTFIDDILQQCGMVNVFAGMTRYPTLTTAQLQSVSPELVLLSSEPFPFGATHLAELQTIFPQAEIKLVDGEMFSWYGSRLLHTAHYFSQHFT